MKTKNLVITSDDFGMSVGINQGICVAAISGHIQCTNYMVPTPFFEHAVVLASQLPIEIGVHFTLTNEWDFYKWRPITRSKNLVDGNGYLYQNIFDLMKYADRHEIRMECCAQLELAQKRDPRISFVDVHMCIPTIENGVLLNPDYELELMDIVKEVARDFRLIYPYELENKQLRHFDSHLSISGKTPKFIEDYLVGLTPGDHHLSCHCSVDSHEISHFVHEDSLARPWALEYRLADSQMISSSWFKEIIERENIRLIPLAKANIHK